MEDRDRLALLFLEQIARGLCPPMADPQNHDRLKVFFSYLPQSTRERLAQDAAFYRFMFAGQGWAWQDKEAASIAFAKGGSRPQTPEEARRQLDAFAARQVPDLPQS